MLKVFSTLVFLFVSSLTFSQESKVQLCGTPDSQIIDAKVLERMRNAGKNPNLRMADLPMLECLVAVAVEYDIYLNYNKNQDLIRERVYQHFEKVSKVYEDEMNIKLTVNHIEIITTNRNDTLQKSKNLLGYHIAHLFRLGAAIPGYASGIAYIKGSSTGQYDLYCISGLFNQKEVFNVMAHEIGHCFDSPHTHNCQWPNGPIDLCGQTEGECEGSGFIPSIGTIMSYCQSNILTFHPLCKVVIRNRAEEILKPINNLPLAVNKKNIYKHNLSTEPILSWLSNNGTERYRVQIADNQQFSKPLIDTTIRYNFFKGFGLSYGKTYFLRIKSINRFGESNWSDFDSFECVIQNEISIPVIKRTLIDSVEIQKVKLEVFPVNGATKYEFRMTDYISYLSYGFSKTFLTEIKNYNSLTPSIIYSDLDRSDFQISLIYWQVRAVKDNVASEWSAIQSFQRLSEPVIIFPKEQSNTTTSLPIIWSKSDSEVNREYTIQASENESFSNILFEKKRILNTLGSLGGVSNLGYEIVENLKPNTTYFFRVKEKNGLKEWRTKSFRTGNVNNKWKAINPLENPLVNLPYFTPFLEQDSSKFYFKNDFGIFKTDGINWETPLRNLAQKGFISLQSYSKVGIDSKKNIYFNNDKGIFKTDGSTIVNITKNPIFENKRIHSFYIDKQDNLYVVLVSDTGVIDIYRGYDENWTKLPQFFKNIPQILKFDSDNNLYIQVFNSSFNSDGRYIIENSIYKLSNNRWELFFQTNISSFATFNIDGKNNVWWTDFFNIFKIEPNKKVTTFKAGVDIPNGSFKSITFAKNGVVWVLAEVNNKVVLLKYFNNQWNRIDIENDHPLPLSFINDYVGMDVDKLNRLWISTTSYGTYIYDDSGQVKSQTINTEKILNQRNTAKPFKIIANSSSNLPLSYKIVSGPAKVKKDSITLTGEVGKVTLQITQPGNEIYEPAKNVDLSFEVTAKANQIISFAKIEQKTLAERTFTLSATTTSGLPIIYQIVSGSATVNGNVVTLTGTGKVTIKAKQEGNAEFLAANEVMQEFCVIPAKPIISVNAANNWILEVNTDKNLQWYFNGTKVENGTKSTLLATQNGQYKVDVFNSDASCASNTSDIFQLLILANEDDKNQIIKVFPNPADDWVTVDSENFLKINSIKLYDLKGSLLYTNEKFELPHKIKIQHSWQGNVLLEIKTDEKTYLKKLVLN